MSNLYEQMDFILSGGALKSLVEFLTPKVSSALIVSPKGADLEVVDAIGTKTDGLFLQGWAPLIASSFQEQAKGKRFEVNFASVNSAAIKNDWPWVAALRGKHWVFYILLRENPEAILEELTSVAGLVALWQEFQYAQTTEERLSRMAYMVLAAKNTLASIFEPMPLDYYASFLTDVIKESLFPSAVSIFRDDGATLTLIAGKDQPPARNGIYTQKMLPSIPVMTKHDSPPYEATLPITEPYRLFCVIRWDKMPEKEALGFLELIGNLASRALAINSLRAKSEDEKGKVSSGKYTILMLSEALSALNNIKSQRDLLFMTTDIFTEMTKVKECLLVAWDKELGGYAPYDYRKDGIRTPCEPLLLPSDRVSLKAETPFFNLATQEFSELLKYPWPEMIGMKLVFPIWDRDCMNGFIAVSSDDSALGDDILSALAIVARFTAYSLRNLA